MTLTPKHDRARPFTDLHLAQAELSGYLSSDPALAAFGRRFAGVKVGKQTA